MTAGHENQVWSRIREEIEATLFKVRQNTDEARRLLGQERNAIAHATIRGESVEELLRGASVKGLRGAPVGRGTLVERGLPWSGVTVADPVGPPPVGPGECNSSDDPEELHRVLVPASAKIAIEAPAARLVVTPPARAARWLDSAAVFIPKSIREPFFGDLREDLADMAAKGHSPAAIRWAAISQVVVLVLRWAWSSVVRR